jgi:hypothetical protein
MNGMSNADSREALLDKIQSVCGQRSGPSRTPENSLPISPALSGVGELLQQAGNVSSLLGQRAGQVRERFMR